MPEVPASGPSPLSNHPAPKKGMVLIKRQSSFAQTRDHLGSAPAQEEARYWVNAYGWDPNQVRIVDALGESGQEWADRRIYRQVLEDAKAGRVGVLILPLFSRVGRNDRDTLELIDAIKSHQGLVLSERRLFDPNDANDAMMLRFYSVIAEHQIANQADWLRQTKLKLAQQCALHLPQPGGLTWAKLDEDYLNALAIATRSAGSSHWLEMATNHQERWEARTLRDAEIYFPVWFPDAEVITSVEMRLTEFYRSGSVGDVGRMVELDPAYPRSGLIPVCNEQVWRPGQQVTWVRATHSALRAWLARPALYGIYSYTTGRSRRMAPEQRAQVEPTIFERDVFPSYRPSADYDEVVRKLANPRRRRLTNVAVQCRHLIPVVRCAHPITEDRICGRKLYPTTVKGKFVRYQSPQCAQAHGTAMSIDSSLLDSVVTDVVKTALDPQKTRIALDASRLEAREAGDEMQRLKEQIDEAEKDVEASGKTSDLHHKNGNRELAELAANRQASYYQALQELRRRLQVAIGDAETSGSMTKADVENILHLASNLTELFNRSAAAPDAVRNLVDACVTGVFLKKLGRSTWQVDIDFPTGVVVRRVIRGVIADRPQALTAWAYARLAAGASARQVAGELNALIGRTGRRVAYSEALVHAAAEEYKQQPPNSSREPRRSLAELADVGGLSSRDIDRLVVRGSLGEAFVEEEELWLAPSEVQLHGCFPEYARRRTAAVAPGGSWPMEDTVVCKEAALRIGVAYNTLVDRARTPGRSGMIFDLAGRGYVRHSEVVADLERVVEKALSLSDAARGLDRAHWISLPEALRRSKTDRETLLATAPFVQLLRRGNPIPNLLVWLGPPVLRQLADASVRASVAALNAEAGEGWFEPKEFHTVPETVARIGRDIERFSSVTLWDRRGRRGQFTTISALAVVSERLLNVPHVHVPNNVWLSNDPDVVHRWVYGPSRVERYRQECAGPAPQFRTELPRHSRE